MYCLSCVVSTASTLSRNRKQVVSAKDRPGHVYVSSCKQPGTVSHLKQCIYIALEYIPCCNPYLTLYLVHVISNEVRATERASRTGFTPKLQTQHINEEYWFHKLHVLLTRQCWNRNVDQLP